MQDTISEQPTTTKQPATTGQAATTDALTTIINILQPLASEDRQRIVGAAMTFLGETAPPKHRASGNAGAL